MARTLKTIEEGEEEEEEKILDVQLVDDEASMETDGAVEVVTLSSESEDDDVIGQRQGHAGAKGRIPMRA